MIDVEQESESIYRTAGYEPRELPGPTALAAALLGPRAVFPENPTAVCGQAELVYEGRWIVLVRNDLAPALRDFAIYHEIWEWWIKQRCSFSGGWKAKETICDAGAACLQLPRAVFEASLTELNSYLPEVANEFRATQTAVALRRGEITGKPTAVVFGGKNAWVRGPWTAEQATAEARTGRRGVVRITDAKHRVAVMSA